MGEPAGRIAERRAGAARPRFGLRLFVAVTGVAPALLLPAALHAAPPCPLAVVASGRAHSVIDGRTFVLADGREIRLSGIETPFDDAKSGRAAADPADAGGTLRRVLGENEIVLKQAAAAAPAADRYGRLTGLVFVRTESGETSVQQELISQGRALVAARPRDPACTGDLMAAERAARAAKLGLWGDPRYDLKRAENPAEVLAVRGRFSLVEGKVLSVGESGGTFYLNFGRRWTEDFTVTIAKRNERAFADAGLAPLRLQGRRVQVRGVVEERGGPWIDAVRPEQIEVVGN